METKLSIVIVQTVDMCHVFYFSPLRFHLERTDRTVWFHLESFCPRPGPSRFATIAPLSFDSRSDNSIPSRRGIPSRRFPQESSSSLARNHESNSREKRIIYLTTFPAGKNSKRFSFADQLNGRSSLKLLIRPDDHIDDTFAKFVCPF